MSTKTEAELASAVLMELGVIDQTETADTEDTNGVIASYENKYNELAAPAGDQELIYWPKAVIPAAVFLTLRDLIINEVKGGYGEPMAPQEKEANEVFILKRLRKHVSRPASGTRTRAEYF